MSAGAPATGEELVVLVDPHDRVLGSGPKLQVHREGVLHRAFSVFVFDSQRDLLLQQRARGKYHSGGLWTNTCCGHPRVGEDTGAAAARRLREEMGMACRLRSAGTFIYRADVGGGLIEHEVDHVFVGWTDAEPTPDPAEVAGWRRVSASDVRRELERAPQTFTSWLPQALDLALSAVPQPSADR